MSEQHQTILRENPTQSKWSEEPWHRVMTAIVERWPHLDQRDVENLPCDVFELESFLSEFTETPHDEIQAVVREYAPAPSIVQHASHLSGQVGERVLPPVQSMLERARYEVDERPGTVAGLIFVTGIALGAMVTASYFQSRQRVATFQSYVPRHWRS